MKQFMANYCVIHLDVCNQINHKAISQIDGFKCRSKSGNWTTKLKDGHREKNAQKVLQKTNYVPHFWNTKPIRWHTVVRPETRYAA